jgi:hypothetical protein
MRDELLLFKNEFDWKKRITSKPEMNTLEAYSIGVITGGGAILAFQLALALIDKL